MDNLTHSLTGLLLSRAGLNRLHPKASALLICAANAPDVDVVTWLWGSDTYLQLHRGLTHALIAIPVMAILPMLLLRTFSRAAFLLSAIGVASHLAFDWTNHYGTRLLLPFSHEWLQLGTTFVIDVWIWAALILALIVPAFSGLINFEIGARPARGRGAAIAALSLILAYDTARIFLKDRAVAVQSAHLYNGLPPKRIWALPHPFHPLWWTGVVENDRSYIVQDVNLAKDFDPTQGRTFYKGQHLPAIESARAARAFQALQSFTQLPLWRVTPGTDGGFTVQLMDLRFGTPIDPRFVATAELDSDLNVQRSDLRF